MLTGEFHAFMMIYQSFRRQVRIEEVKSGVTCGHEARCLVLEHTRMNTGLELAEPRCRPHAACEERMVAW